MTTYITTPIYYPNDRPHLGTAYPTVAADVVARWARLSGQETFFLTGTDEHGKKIETAAKEQNLDPKAFVDKISVGFKETFTLLEISNDRFIRTTDEDHVRVVQAFVQRVYDKGDIYKGVYKGLYCVKCEAYYKEDDLIDRNCPIHATPVDELEEESYFFRLSKYQDWLLNHIEAHPDFIIPSQRRNEVVSFVKRGLDDFSMSRSTFRWGIPLPFDRQHITYVWFDALLNYITGVGYLDQPEQFEQYWPSATHIIGKDILRFHAIYWPAMLKSAGLLPPKRIVAHGFWTINGRKFGKSMGNVIRPEYLVDTYGLDPLRFYMLRAFPFGMDGDFSEARLVERNNNELANGLGNLLQRTLTLILRYRDGLIPGPHAEEDLERDLAVLAHRTVQQVNGHLDNLAFKDALDAIWRLVHELNAYINTRKPWVLAREDNDVLLDTTLSFLAEGLRFLSTLVAPFIPRSAETIARRIGLTEVPKVNTLQWGSALTGQRVLEDSILFEKLELPVEEAPPLIQHGAHPRARALGISYCVAQLQDVRVRKQVTRLEQRKRVIEREIRRRGRAWADDKPEARGYHELYAKIGKAPGEIVSPLESLSAYIFDSGLGRIPQINAVVDLYNVYSLRTGLSIGAHDREKIRGAIYLDVAEALRSYQPLGAQEEVQIHPGEYYWRDNEQVLCRLDVKQGEATKVDEQTRHIVLIVQGHGNIAPDIVRRETKALCREIVDLCGGTYQVLDAPG